MEDWFVALLWLLEAREALGGADVGEVVDEDAQDPFAGAILPDSDSDCVVPAI